MRSRPSGSSVSRCQIMAGASPLTSRIATARSRSQLEPGKTMTALFMGLCPSGGALDPDILDHGVGEELPAHRLDLVVADAFGPVAPHSEDRSVGQECVSTCRFRWSPNY